MSGYDVSLNLYLLQTLDLGVQLSDGVKADPIHLGSCCC